MGGEDLNDEQLRNLYDLGLLSPGTAKRVQYPEGTKTESISDQGSGVSRPIFMRPSVPHTKSESAERGSSSQRPSLRSKRGMTGVLDIDRAHTRKDRTFAGSACAVCEEPLEHTLRGEKILQLSCAHVTHEACFYEYIREFESSTCPTCEAPLGLDSSRGGNVLDMDKLSAIVRSIQLQRPDSDSIVTHEAPSSWSQHSQSRADDAQPPELPGRDDEAPIQYHHRNDSSTSRNIGMNPSGIRQSNGRQHDYDVSAMETSLSPRNSAAKNPVPPPTVLVRSEFPTLTRSRQQQSLTCLVTVEVTEGKWYARPEDIRNSTRVGTITEESEPASAAPQAEKESYESAQEREQITKDLHSRVDNWHGLDFTRFGKLRLHGPLKVGKDRQSWQELECYLFAEMLICVKEKKIPQSQNWDGGSTAPSKTKCTLKGSIMIKKHLNQIDHSTNDLVLTLNLSVAELPSFHLHFESQSQLEIWRRALVELNSPNPPKKNVQIEQQYNSGTDEEDLKPSAVIRSPSMASSWGGPVSSITAPTDFTTGSRFTARSRGMAGPTSLHVPVDIVIVIPVSSSMHGLKISVLRDMLRFLVQSLGERDRMGLVTFGSNSGAVPLVHMTTKTWTGWEQIIGSIKAVGQRSLKGDLVEGANAAMDLLMQRKFTNPLSSILIVSDSSTAESESVDFVVSRAEAAKVSIYSFGLGLTHKPDTMIELSTRTKASYTYAKDWMMLRECIAGCFGSLQSTAHRNVKLKLRLPDGSPAKFVKISGALHITKRASGRDAEASLGDLRFGDKRDILVQLIINPDEATSDHLPPDAWESIVSGLEALGGPLESDDNRPLSVEEVPIIQADLNYGDVLREGTICHLPRPSLLAITMFPGIPTNNKTKAGHQSSTPQIPPHPLVVQRRMELLTSDMLTRALTLVSKGQQDKGKIILRETRTILRGLGKGGLPPIPTPSPASTPLSGIQPAPFAANTKSTAGSSNSEEKAEKQSSDKSPPSPREMSFSPTSGIDSTTMAALDTELESSLEWIDHPAVFARDSRKSILQAIGVISSQRAFTFRTPLESLWADRVSGIRSLSEAARNWREDGDEALMMEEEGSP